MTSSGLSLVVSLNRLGLADDGDDACSDDTGLLAPQVAIENRFMRPLSPVNWGTRAGNSWDARVGPREAAWDGREAPVLADTVDRICRF